MGTYLLLDLLRYSLHDTPSPALQVSTVDWSAMYAEAKKHTVVGVAWPGVHKLLSASPKEVKNLSTEQTVALKTWCRHVRMDQEQYAKHRHFIARLAQLYEMIGIRTMLLKGYGLSLNYPVPSLRMAGDVDIFLFDDESLLQDMGAGETHSIVDSRPTWQRADEMISSLFHTPIDASHDHHTTFWLEGFLVENHYDFTVVAHHKSNEPLEQVLKALSQDHSHFTLINDQRIYLPSPQMNALFLLRHTSSHFAAYGLRLRQVLDWAYFVQSLSSVPSQEGHPSSLSNASSLSVGSVSSPINIPSTLTDISPSSDNLPHPLWQWLIPEAERFGLLRFLSILNRICYDELGFSQKMFPPLPCDEQMYRRVLQSVLEGKEPDPHYPVPFQPLVRTTNWCRHWWKHRLCYPESFLPALFTQIKSNVFH